MLFFKDDGYKNSAGGIFISWGKAIKFELKWGLMKTQCHQPLNNFSECP